MPSLSHFNRFACHFAVVVTIFSTSSSFADLASLQNKITTADISAIQINEDKAAFIALEQGAKSEDQLISLAEAYFDGGHFQQTIWTLWKVKQFGVADQLTDKVKKIFETSEIQFSHGIREGKYDTVSRVYFQPKRGVMSAAQKERTPDSAVVAEVLTYAVDRLLRLGIVPVVTQRDNATMMMYVYRNQDAPYGFYKNEAKYAEIPYERLHLLDYLIQHGDRHDGNWLITYSGEEVAIDNDMALQAKTDSAPGNMLQEWKRKLTRPELIARLRELTPADFHAALKDIAPVEIREQIIARLLEVKKSL